MEKPCVSSFVDVRVNEEVEACSALAPLPWALPLPAAFSAFTFL